MLVGGSARLFEDGAGPLDGSDLQGVEEAARGRGELNMLLPLMEKTREKRDNRGI